MTRFIGILGIALVVLVCWLMSENRKQFPWRMLAWGFALQFGFAIIVLHLPFGVSAISWFGDRVTEFLNFGNIGAQFLFGNIVKREYMNTFGFQFAFTVLPTIIFFASFMSVMYYLGIMQRVVFAMAWIMGKTLGTSGVESLSASANIFLGQTEAPLLVKPFLANATRSEIHAIMVGGFITIAGGVMAGYIQMGIPASALITASIIAAPAGLMLSKIVVPPMGTPKTVEELRLESAEKGATNIVEAAANGALDGLKLALNIAAMLIAFIALIAAVNALFGVISATLASIGIPGFPPTLRDLFGLIFHPVAILLGIPPSEAHIYGGLIGTKISINEFVAYSDLSGLIAQHHVSERTATMATFALCGFANFSSVAIQIGGIGAMIPERKGELAQLGLKAMITGALGSMMTSAIAGILLP